MGATLYCSSGVRGGGSGGDRGRYFFFKKPNKNDLRTHTSSRTMTHHTQHMREATHANTTYFFLFVCFKRFVFILYKVTSHHLSLNTEAGLTDRQAGR